jgi:TetR/AcrR family transcriptional repressor of mexCD-oprJ operon
MRALAAAEGYAVTAVYRCYPSRAALLKAIQLRLFAELPAALGFAELGSLPLLEALETLGVRFVAWGVANPARYRFMFLDDEPDALLSGPEQALARAPLLALAMALGGARLREGIDAEAAATWLFAGLHGLVALHLQGRLDPATVPDPAAFVAAHSRAWLATFVEEDA